jgi:hypothetical protein
MLPSNPKAIFLSFLNMWSYFYIRYLEYFFPVSKYESDFVIMTPTATATSTIEFDPPLSPR